MAEPVMQYGTESGVKSGMETGSGFMGDSGRSSTSTREAVREPAADEAIKQWDESVYRYAEHIQEAVRTYLGFTVSIGFSRTFSEWSEVPMAYKEALEALKYRVKLGNEALIPIEDVLSGASGHSTHSAYPGKLSEELRGAIKVSDREKAAELLDRFMLELVKPPFHLQKYQFSLIRLLGELGGLLQDHDIPLDSINKEAESLVDNLLKLRTAEETAQWLKETVIGPVLSLMEERRASQFRNISQDVMAMIHDAFDTDLTLEACAARIDYHPHYVSKVFRQEAGINFSDYLLQHRLVMAKQWLVETDMKISDIAEKLKYTNSANFIRYFRKIEGITPGQYREKMLAGREQD
jgi:two-component system response regulator YesN